MMMTRRLLIAACLASGVSRTMQMEERLRIDQDIPGHCFRIVLAWITKFLVESDRILLYTYSAHHCLRPLLFSIIISSLILFFLFLISYFCRPWLFPCSQLPGHPRLIHNVLRPSRLKIEQRPPWKQKKKQIVPRELDLKHLNKWM